MDDVNTRAAPGRPNSYDPETDTFETTITTFADVRRAGCVERLAPDSVAPEAFLGKPYLDNHKRTSVDDILGTVESAWAEPGQIAGRIKLAQTPRAQTVRAILRAGGTLGTSMGYRTPGTKVSTEQGTRVRTATRVTPLEVSAAIIPTEPGASSRSHPVTDETTTAEPVQTTTRTAEEVTQHRAAVRELARSSGLSTEWADEQIDSNATLDEIKARAFDQMQKRTKPQIRIVTQHDSPDNMFERRAGAMYARATGTAPKPESREFMGDTVRDTARACLEAVGISTRGLTPDELFRAAFHSGSDFPALTQATGDRAMTEAYELASSPIRQQLCRQTTHTDFRPKSMIGLSDMSGLEELPENGAITYGTMQETADSWSLSIYGKGIAFGRRMAINDSIGGFTSAAATAGRMAAQKEAAEVMALIAANPTISETGNALFSVGHANYTAAAVNFDVASLNLARKAMRVQKDLTGEHFVGAVPQFLVVGPEQESAAEALMATIFPTTVDGVNTSPQLTILVEPRITDNAAMIFASPASAPVLWVSYLAEAPGPQFAQEDDFDTMGVKFRVVLDFATHANDFRGAYRFDDVSGAV